MISFPSKNVFLPCLGKISNFIYDICYCLSGVCMFVSSAVDREFDPRSGETKHFKTCIGCFSVRYAAWRSKNDDWMAPSQYFYLSEATCLLLFLITPLLSSNCSFIMRIIHCYNFLKVKVMLKIFVFIVAFSNFSSYIITLDGRLKPGQL